MIGASFAFFIASGLLAAVGARGGASPAPGHFPRARRSTYPALTRRRERRWKGPFFFIQIADTQFGMFAQNQSWDRETELFSRAVAAINRLKPRFVIMSGDMVNQPAGEPAHAAQVAEYLRIARRIDPAIPLLGVCGNHDVGNRPTRAALAAYRREFGDDRYTFWAGGICGLVLNSNLYWDPTGAQQEQARQEVWFARSLRAAREAGAKQILVFQHHSWFLEKPDEPDQYFTIPRARRDPALSLMREAGVRASFAGHYHRNAYGRDGDLEMITTSAVGQPLGSDPSGFRIVKVFEDRIEHAYYRLDEVPEAVSLG
jgi:3',5'-cyclic AMP phosphodiesterase CpdA